MNEWMHRSECVLVSEAVWGHFGTYIGHICMYYWGLSEPFVQCMARMLEFYDLESTVGCEEKLINHGHHNIIKLLVMGLSSRDVVSKKQFSFENNGFEPIYTRVRSHVVCAYPKPLTCLGRPHVFASISKVWVLEIFLKLN